MKENTKRLNNTAVINHIQAVNVNLGDGIFNAQESINTLSSVSSYKNESSIKGLYNITYLLVNCVPCNVINLVNRDYIKEITSKIRKELEKENISITKLTKLFNSITDSIYVSCMPSSSIDKISSLVSEAQMILNNIKKNKKDKDMTNKANFINGSGNINAQNSNNVIDGNITVSKGKQTPTVQKKSVKDFIMGVISSLFANIISPIKSIWS